MAGSATAVRLGPLARWVRRYLPAEITGTLTALLAASIVDVAGEGPVVVAYVAALAESVGFYSAFVAHRLLVGEGSGGRVRRLGVVVAATVAEFGPAEVLDTLLVRPAAMYAAARLTGDVMVGVVVGKLLADLVFYGLAAAGHQVLVVRLLRWFARGVVPPVPDLVPAPVDPGPVERPVRRPVAPAGDEPGPPRLVLDLDVVTATHRRFVAALPGVGVHFAMKCNPDPPLLAHLDRLGAGFEIASAPELEVLRALGVDPADVIFSNPVKPWWHVRDAFTAGVWRFGVDSEVEVAKLARWAPGSGVCVRLSTRGASTVASEGKFGVDPSQAYELVHAAVAHGLRPWGLGFHVGSQMLDPDAWTVPIRDAGTLMRRLAADGITLSALDLGGGFPADYGEPVPAIETYGSRITAELARLPYPVEVVAEPGRGLVADAGTLVATVIGVAVRRGQRWLHLDVGAFNGGMEALETGHRLVLPITTTRTGAPACWHVTGPSCDSQDSLRFGASLPSDLAVGDQVRLHTAGAYTTAYASRFNGFDVPSPDYVGGVEVSDSRTPGPLVYLCASAGWLAPIAQ